MPKKKTTSTRRRRTDMPPNVETVPKMYTVELSLATVEALEQGRCPEALANYAHDLLRWRREAIRATTPTRTYAGHER